MKEIVSLLFHNSNPSRITIHIRLLDDSNEWWDLVQKLKNLTGKCLIQLLLTCITEINNKTIPFTVSLCTFDAIHVHISSK